MTVKDTITDWNGYEQRMFEWKGRECVAICPKEAAEGTPWVWRAEFLYAFDFADRELLARGWHIVYVRLSNLYGSPYAVEQMRAFHLFVEDKLRLCHRPAIFGFSRGGLYAFRYAAAYPESVAILYLDAPVLDFNSWPGGNGIGERAPTEWQECLSAYGLNEEDAATYDKQPLDLIGPVAEAGIPILLVAGDADTAVPYAENGAILAERYSLRGGPIEVILKPGVGHHPHSLEDPSPIVAYIEANRL